MKKQQLKIMLLISIFTLAFSACSHKDTMKEAAEMKTEDSKKENKDKNELEEDKKAEETKKAEEAKKAEKAKKAEEAKKVEEAKKAEEAKKLDNQVLSFNSRETENLRSLARKLGTTIIDDGNTNAGKVDPNQLEAISVFEKKDSYGWICKYGDNQIGVAEIPHKTVTDENGDKYNPIQVVRIWNEYKIFNGSPSGIRNNNPEQFKLAAKEIAEVFFDKDTTIKHLFE